MNTFTNTALAAALGASTLVSGGQAAALQPINQNDHIIQSLLAAAIGDEIRHNCPTISARMFRALSEAKKLERYALDQGYSDKEIEDFLESKAERRAMKARRDAYLAKHGVTAGNADSYCSLGMEEIAKGSLTGSLLRAH